VSSAEVSTTYTQYVLGEWVTQPVEKLQRDEEWSKQGHMPWRAEPALVARVLAGNIIASLTSGEEPVEEDTQEDKWLVPKLTTSSIEITFEISEKSENVVDVTMAVNGVIEATIQLERPFGYWWYITSVATPQGVASRPTSPTIRWVSVRQALGGQGFSVSWQPAGRSVAVTKRGVSRMELKVGDRAVRLGARTMRLDTAPRLCNGRVLIPEYLIADLLSQDARMVASLHR
jgi:hypothetical protein